MRPAEVAALVAMAALWGGSFVFQRVLVPVFGPWALTFVRLAFAGAFLVAVALWRKEPALRLSRIGVLAGLSALGAAAPYVLFAFGASTLSTALLAVLNATAPMFGAMFAAIWLAERLSWLRSAGLLVGIAGVAVSGQVWSAGLPARSHLAVAACLLAAACYGLYGIAVRRSPKPMEPLELAAGSQALGAVWLAVPSALTRPERVEAWHLALAALFGVLCSGVPFLLYTWLLGRVGPTRALTVTFLIPVFGALWGYLVLHEGLTWSNWVGGVLILAGTYMVTRKEPPRRTVPDEPT